MFRMFSLYGLLFLTKQSHKKIYHCHFHLNFVFSDIIYPFIKGTEAMVAVFFSIATMAPSPIFVNKSKSFYSFAPCLTHRSNLKIITCLKFSFESSLLQNRQLFSIQLSCLVERRLLMSLDSADLGRALLILCSLMNIF